MKAPIFKADDVAICIDNASGTAGTESLTIGKEYIIIQAEYAGFDEHILIVNDAGRKVCYWPGRFKKRPAIVRPVTGL